MKFEFSAGGVVYKKDKDVISILLVQSRRYHHWSFPKGHIADTITGETKEQAALREVKEETGIDGEIEKALDPQEYWYEFEGEKRKKTVYYFLMRFLGGDTHDRDDEMENVEWVEESHVEERLTYPADKEVYQEAQHLLHR